MSHIYVDMFNGKRKKKRKQTSVKAGENPMIFLSSWEWWEWRGARDDSPNRGSRLAAKCFSGDAWYNFRNVLPRRILEGQKLVVF